MAARQVTPRTLLLAAAALAALVVLVAIWPRGTADTTGSSPQGAGPAVGSPLADPAVPPALGLEGMQAARAVPANKRDLFRFGAAPPAGGEIGAEGPDSSGQAPAGRRGAAPPPGEIEQPAAPPPPPPIPLRFVGLIQTARGQVASLTDGKFVYNAREGDIVEGRWRVVKIGAESVVIERIDGTGRQTLRLAGG